MFTISENRYKYYRYLGLVTVVILGVVSILGSGGGGDSTPPPPSAPSVIAVLPSASSDTALVTSVVTAQFNKDMDPQTINDPEKNFFIIDNVTKIPVDGSVLYWGTYLKVYDNVAVFTPDNDLVVGREYVATVTTDVKDTSGDPLARDYNWSFSIAPSPVPVSTDATGRFGASGIDITSSSMPNATGEYVVFASTDNLANLNTGGKAQIYRKNTITKRIELVSTTGDNLTVADGPCASPRISDTGRYVVFTSLASNLDPTVTNTASKSHIYIKDMRDGTIRLLDRSITNVGEAGNGYSSMPDISGITDTGSGKYVVFESTAIDLHVDDTDTTSDIFMVNVTSETLELISVSLDQTNNPADGPSSRPRVSDDGQRIVFESNASNLVLNDSNTVKDIFLRDSGTTTTRLSVDSTGAQANGSSSNADISADGNYVAFQSIASNLVVGDGSSRIDIFLRNLTGNTTTWLSANTAGVEANGDSTLPSINEDGHYVAFSSTASDLVTSDPNVNIIDVFARYTQPPGTIELLSISPTFTNNLASSQPSISTNGRYISFTTLNKFDDADHPSTNDIYRAYNTALP